MAQPMARGRLTFRERDVTAAIRAVEKTGHKVARVSIGQDGSIVVELAPPVGSATGAKSGARSQPVGRGTRR